MFFKLNHQDKKKILKIMVISLAIVFLVFGITLELWRDHQVFELTKVHLKGKSIGNGAYTFSWNSAGKDAKYKLLRYNSAKDKYVTWKTVNQPGDTDTIELTTAKELGKYKVRTTIMVGDTGITYDSANLVEVRVNLNKAKKYSKIHTIKTINKDDVELIANAKGKGKVTHAQSICSTGDGYIVTLVDRGNTTGRLEKFDRQGNLLKTRKTSYVGHANGSTYNPNNGSVYVMRTYAKRRHRTVSVFDGKTLKPKKNVDLKVTPSAIAYDKQKNQYYFTAGNRIYKMNGKLQGRKTYYRKRWHHSQDVCGYNGIIMSCIWTSGKNSFIDMYRSDNGAYIGTISIPLGEIESVCVDDGYLVLLYNGGNIYRTKERLTF